MSILFKAATPQLIGGKNGSLQTRCTINMQTKSIIWRHMKIISLY